MEKAIETLWFGDEVCLAEGRELVETAIAFAPPSEDLSNASICTGTGGLTVGAYNLLNHLLLVLQVCRKQHARQ
ncbi:MAG: hypothetical protein HONBIEJF_02727 [Fimbriimonadaceae bacterium]|nr:hypothetical protein [Fimbriimonadaceae bacterium]